MLPTPARWRGDVSKRWSISLLVAPEQRVQENAQLVDGVVASQVEEIEPQHHPQRPQRRPPKLRLVDRAEASARPSSAYDLKTKTAHEEHEDGVVSL